MKFTPLTNLFLSLLVSFYLAPTLVNAQTDCIDVQLSVLLEGPYQEMDGEMWTKLNRRSDDILYRGVLPGQEKVVINLPGIEVTPPFQPYTATPWNYNGMEGQTDFAPWYYAPGSTAPMGDSTYAVYHPDVVDWVLLRFRSGTILPTNTTVVEKTAAALLLADGTIILAEPCAIRRSDFSTNFVYAQIDHRNHMAVMTPEPIDISNDELYWDFRIQDSFHTPQSYGQKEIPVGSGTWAMYTGDGDQVNDTANYDIASLDNVLSFDQGASFDVYLEGDFNMQADVGGADRVLWSPNNGICNRVPKN